jgi:DNA-binding PadR family transcriptional regulator
VQEVVLALLAKEPSHGYDVRARLRQPLGPLGAGMNAGQVYVTLPDVHQRWHARSA